MDRCELSIVEGNTTKEDAGDSEDQDSLESKLIVRLHCKHGNCLPYWVAYHRLLSFATSN